MVALVARWGVRNRRPDLNGVLVVDKPLRWSSAKVCAHIRRATGGAKVGHAGTLDPLATGVLVVALGSATKSIPIIQAMPKAYRAAVDLSAFTTTDDAEGVRAEVAVDSPPALARIRDLLAREFTGEVRQRPPAFSAIKVGGERSYRRARRGDEGLRDDIPERLITVHAVGVVAYDFPTLTLDIACSKGTYIRSIARDVGERLGTGGTLASLVRTSVGRYTLRAAVSPDGAGIRANRGQLQPPPEQQPPPPQETREPGMHDPR